LRTLIIRNEDTKSTGNSTGFFLKVINAE